MLWKIILLGLSLECINAWSNLNCPAPRSPKNGLSFIFQDGARVEYRCHPGFRMKGRTISRCINNRWNHPPPKCIALRKGAPDLSHLNDPDVYYIPGKNEQPSENTQHVQESRPLFNWNDKEGVYGDGARRLPLINGIWPPQDEANKVLAIGPVTTPFPQTLVKEEIEIAELRQKQLEELKGQRQKNIRSKGKRRNGQRRKNKHRNGTRKDKSDKKATLITIVETTDGPEVSVSRVNRRRHWNHRMTKLQRQNIAGSSNGYVSSRRSRVTGGIPAKGYRRIFDQNNAEFRGRSLESLSYTELQLLSTYDTSCVDEMFNRTVPKRAPLLRNSFVYRYETMRDPPYVYMVAKYRCFTGYHLVDKKITELYCKKRQWVGEPPLCVKD